MFIREDLISAQFRLKGEISQLNTKLVQSQAGESTEQLKKRIRDLREKMDQLRTLLKY